jgi:peroxiredoxin
MVKANLGDLAPDFQVKDHYDKMFKLSELKGKKVLMSWHPLAWTSVCAEQMKSLEANLNNFRSLNTIGVGMSVDTVPSKTAWAKELKIQETKLLSDFWPHGEVAKKYGIFREKNGFSERVNIIIDEDQKIIFFKVYEIRTLPDIEEIITFLKRHKKQ